MVLFFYCLKMRFCDGDLIFFKVIFDVLSRKVSLTTSHTTPQKGISVEENMFSMFCYGTFCRKMFHAKHLFYLIKLCYT